MSLLCRVAVGQGFDAGRVPHFRPLPEDETGAKPSFLRTKDRLPGGLPYGHFYTFGRVPDERLPQRRRA